MRDDADTAVAREAAQCLAPIEEIVEDMRNGRMVILVDAENRENEGDLVIPAQMATPDAVNFMAKYGRGLVCLALTEARAADLRLEAMVRTNRSRNRTAFTVSVEAREGIETGISTRDRAHTIATAIDPDKGPDDIISPGHVFPLVARDGGVLVRAGHTEASVDLARLAGLYPAAVICEVMNDDGSMARLDELMRFAARHGLKIGTIDSLIAHRLRHDRLVNRGARTVVETALGGTFDLVVYGTTVDAAEHLALTKGDIGGPEPVLVRVHAVNMLSDLLGIDAEGERESLIAKAMAAIAKEGRGVIVLIRDTRPKVVSEWIAARSGSDATTRDLSRRPVEIGIGSQILRDLGVHEMVLLTNSPAQVYHGVEAFGLSIAGTRRIA